MLEDKAKYTEREVELRVAFKMGEILTFLKSQKSHHYHALMQGKLDRHTESRFQYIKELEVQIHKEIKMSPPYHNMSETEHRRIMDTAIEEFYKLFNLRGQRDHHEKRKRIVGIVDRLLRNFY